jgi:methylmalonyl-CoA mutase N-terminal domain/subunit
VSSADRERWRRAVDAREVPPARTESGLPLQLLYTPEDTAALDYGRDLGYPGQPPFTRGVYETMYRTNLWTFRQYAGFGTAEESNARYRYLLAQGQTALSVAFDLPTQLGYDSDHPMAEEEVGRVGVVTSSLEDMERLFDSIPMEKVSVNFTINATAPIVLAMYLAAARRRGVAWSALAGTLQNDILKEYLARKTYVYPPEPSLRLIGDVIQFCSGEAPRFNPISVTGYHAREAGCNAVQEIAFAMSAAIAYVDLVLARGLRIDDFAPRVSFHFATGLDFFEEIAKLRAARRLWARIVSERYGAENPRSAALRFFSGCSGTCLTTVEPLNNVIRSTIQCLAAVLAGAQSVHVMAYDEAFEIPTEESVLLSLRTQQIIARETGIASVVDPLGGSYYVESLTDELERAAREMMERIEALGGAVKAVTSGELQRWIADTSYQTQRDIHTGAKPVVGVNVYRREGAERLDDLRLFEADEGLRERQVARLRELRARRDAAAAGRTLAALEGAARTAENLMPYIIDCVEALATVGEISDVLRGVFGEYQEPLVL